MVGRVVENGSTKSDTVSPHKKRNTLSCRSSWERFRASNPLESQSFHPGESPIPLEESKVNGSRKQIEYLVGTEKMKWKTLG